jgi:hypothetical protein
MTPAVSPPGGPRADPSFLDNLETVVSFGLYVHRTTTVNGPFRSAIRARMS